MNQLEAWHKSRVVLINMSYVAQDEARAGGDLRRSRKAISYIFTLTQTLNEQERLECDICSASRSSTFWFGAASRSNSSTRASTEVLTDRVIQES